ncbi:InlB B-repeat-containing protein, partial [Candidatus Saccharibacteria bacterium]|nr:InlB B-repeat-containing protein [Candidatus Saccharibacteria bacterium]
MPTKKRINIEPFACRVTRNGTRNKSTSNLARKGLNAILPALAIAGISAGIVNGSNVNADSLGKQIYFKVDASTPVLQISIDSSTTMTITPQNGGSFGFQDIPVMVGTNSYTGYTLKMSAENTRLSCNSNTNCTSITIGTLSSSVSSTTFSTTGVDNDSTMNKWGYSLYDSTNSGYTTYNKMPSGTELDPAVQIGHSATNVDSEITNVRFGVKMNNNIPAGEYGTTITFLAVTDRVETCAAGSICYVGNGGSGGMDIQTASSGTTQLWASNYRRDGYGFAGWNTSPDGSGTNYGPNEDIA